MSKNKRMLIISVVFLVLGFLILLDRKILPNYINKNYVANLEAKQEKMAEENNKEKEIIEIKTSVPKNNSDKAIYYVGKFIGYINKSEYENAYNCLNEKFKNNNFPTLEQFKNYCTNKYNGFRSISLLNYKINDDIIIAQIDLKSVKDESDIIQFFTIREIDTKVGSFEISFGMGD